MKELVQEVGVRKWFGDEWITLQNEITAVLEGHFGQFSQQFILSGCVVSGTSVSAGIVCLASGGSFKLYRFAGATGVTFPVYFTPDVVEETRLYQDGDVKEVALDYNAILTAVQSGGLLELKADGLTARYTDIIQDATHRFCSDTEKASYAGQAAAAITALRDGVSSQYNTLKKLKDAIPDDYSLDALETELRGYIDGLTYLPIYSGTSVQVGSVIDWRGTPERTIELTDDTEFTATNLIVGKTIGMEITGNYTATFATASGFVKVLGFPDPLSGEINYVQMKCVAPNKIRWFNLYV